MSEVWQIWRAFDHNQDLYIETKLAEVWTYLARSMMHCIQNDDGIPTWPLEPLSHTPTLLLFLSHHNFRSTDL
ncbi:uncharacterized protein Dyak_GE27675, isoform A [Drosophila yakuba]|uniref:Uncharacterized protein, isoform A n=1 Tax=Drosophila yakuba TaxID=7245 RepID=A0A0R1EGU7_DROYA|nr:uncharacterized protein Dyak_GE27675, isoform A [Drosophila yakuba]